MIFLFYFLTKMFSIVKYNSEYYRSKEVRFYNNHNIIYEKDNKIYSLNLITHDNSILIEIPELDNNYHFNSFEVTKDLLIISFRNNDENELMKILIYTNFNLRIISELNYYIDSFDINIDFYNNSFLTEADLYEYSNKTNKLLKQELQYTHDNDRIKNPDIKSLIIFDNHLIDKLKNLYYQKVAFKIESENFICYYKNDQIIFQSSDKFIVISNIFDKSDYAEKVIYISDKNILLIKTTKNLYITDKINFNYPSENIKSTNISSSIKIPEDKNLENSCDFSYSDISIDGKWLILVYQFNKELSYIDLYQININ